MVVGPLRTLFRLTRKTSMGIPVCSAKRLCWSLIPLRHQNMVNWLNTISLRTRCASLVDTLKQSKGWLIILPLCCGLGDILSNSTTNANCHSNLHSRGTITHEGGLIFRPWSCGLFELLEGCGKCFHTCYCL